MQNWLEVGKTRQMEETRSTRQIMVKEKRDARASIEDSGVLDE